LLDNYVKRKLKVRGR